MRFDQSRDANFSTDFQDGRRHFGIIVIPGQLTVLLDFKEPVSIARRVVAEHVQRDLTGMESGTAASDGTVGFVSAAGFILETSALHVLIHALVRFNTHVNLLFLYPAASARVHFCAYRHPGPSGISDKITGPVVLDQLVTPGTAGGCAPVGHALDSDVHQTTSRIPSSTNRMKAGLGM